MKPKRVVQLKSKTEPAVVSLEEADEVLTEIARLYRERIRALYNDDQPALKAIAEQIDRLKAKLPAA